MHKSLPQCFNLFVENFVQYTDGILLQHPLPPVYPPNFMFLLSFQTNKETNTPQTTTTKPTKEPFGVLFVLANYW